MYTCWSASTTVNYIEVCRSLWGLGSFLGLILRPQKTLHTLAGMINFSKLLCWLIA
jgi:hypothetical protein